MKILYLALRSLTRFRLYTFINVLGLALSLACVIIIGRYVYSEWTTDHFIPERDRLYLTTLSFQDNPRTILYGYSAIERQQGDANPLENPAVEQSTTLIPRMNDEVYYENQKFDASLLAVDTSFLQLLPFPVLAGDKNRLFSTPESAAITQAFARKIFGNEDPLGKTLILTIGKQVTIEGIIGEAATNSSLQFDLLVSIERQQIWSNMDVSFALLRPKTDVKSLNDSFEYFQKQSFMGQTTRYGFSPLKNIYFDNQGVSPHHLFASGNYNNILILLAVGILILLVGLLNYINIYTVLLLKRGREFGMKKVFGSGIRQIISQVYVEHLFLIGIALFLAWLFVELGGNFLVVRFGLEQVPNLTFNLVLSAGILFILSAVSSIYPVLRYKYSTSIQSVKGIATGGKGIFFRNTFLTVQYIISISLIIISGFFIKQLHFMLHADLGYRTEDIIKVQFLRSIYSFDETYDEAQSRYEKEEQRMAMITQRMDESPLFSHWLFGSSPHEYKNHGARFKVDNEEYQQVVHTSVDNNYFQLYGLKIIEGRGWDDEVDKFAQYRLILNETAKKLFGITDIHTTLLQPERRLWYSSDTPGMDTNPPYEIVGVVKDFKVGHLSNPVPPIIFSYDKGYKYEKLTAAVVPGRRTEAILFMQKLHEEVIGGDFSYTFVEDEIRAIYEEDEKVASIYSVFAVIAILISSLGLFGLSLFDIQQRYKEIAIRKVNGATTPVIMQLLLNKYIRLLLIAFVIATPVSWLAITKYLEGFVNKASVSWWLFAIALLITAGISLLTLTWQIRKATRTNPAEAIKTD